MTPSYLQPAALCAGVDTRAQFNKPIIGLTYALALCGLTLSSMVNAKTVQVSSPDTHIYISLTDDSGHPEYHIQFNGKTVINPSKLGLVFAQLGELGSEFTIKNVTRNSVDQTWQQPWGERENVRDHYNRIVATLSNGKLDFDIEFKAFNDGIGFRYVVPKQAGLTSTPKLDITDELTEFVIPNPQQTTAWWIPGRGWNRYEYLYRTTTLDKIDRAHTPMTFRTADGVHMSIHEAALTDYAAMVLNQGRDGTLRADLTPWSDGIRVKTQPGFSSPWRTIQIANDAPGLLNSDLILNLNEPNKLGDVSWVQPGKYVGIWWGMHLNENTWGSGPKHGATTSETKRYMDFAAQYGFDGVLVEGWNEGWDGSWFHNGDVFSFTQAYPDFDMEAISQYGKSKNVRLIGHHETSGSVTNYRNQMSDAYDLYKKHGVTQIKTGYVADGGDIKRIDENGITRHEWHDGQFMVNEYLHSVTEAAKRGISINTHEPIKDTGLRRTYPNWIAREGARGQEFNAWGSPPNTPEHTAILPYTRMLAGPMDFTPGIFNLAPEGLEAINRVNTTLTKQLALYVVLYSPIQMAADLPRNYVQRLDAFQFIQDVPTDWNDSIALAGDIGDYVAFARKQRDAEDWYLGALTDEKPRKISIKLDFLTPGKQYQAQIYRDGEKADWLSNPYDYVIETQTVTATDSLTLSLAPSGGTAIRFKAL
ncbi:alpha-glucosidase [Shewanella ulleungensis]|uniref:Alpha-glucosidase n=2 Tax=Shewanella ulleungensis TaxID=2282699 RepID=A0ABQ2QJV8_9GAMM|nr:glycoside hydrolase family 97 protein [Shewanella ulleungensis]MCL1151775.1 glycoside hydrolase family 97 protein [Shewanella ulleungensis]GGP84380.1 alpha-glucosidase [Shewanella ulleungensis]